MEETAELLEKQLAMEISKMTLEEALSLARAFSHYLSLMSIAETHHRCAFDHLFLCANPFSLIDRYLGEEQLDLTAFYHLQITMIIDPCMFYQAVLISCRVRKARNVAYLSKSCDDIFSKLIHGGVPPEELYNTVCKQVFTFLFSPDFTLPTDLSLLLV